jgi:hypothetical protein
VRSCATANSTKVGTQYVPQEQQAPASREYREQLNSQGSPSRAISAGCRWSPGTELAGKVDNLRKLMESETKLGKNRTGMDVSPVDGNEMLQGSKRNVSRRATLKT